MREFTLYKTIKIHGEVTSHSVKSLQHALFTANTGVHPSYPNRMPAPNNPERQASAEIAGSFAVDVGVVLAEPKGQEKLEVVAGHGPYRSNQLQIILRP